MLKFQALTQLKDNSCTTSQPALLLMKFQGDTEYQPLICIQWGEYTIAAPAPLSAKDLI